jgi:hypothetical protein
VLKSFISLSNVFMKHNNKCIAIKGRVIKQE